MKQMDEELSKRIKAVFDDYNDDHSENGWAELRKKYPEKEDKKLPIWWITGIAAAVLLAFGLFLTFDQDTINIKKQQQFTAQDAVTKSNAVKNPYSKALSATKVQDTMVHVIAEKQIKPFSGEKTKEKTSPFLPSKLMAKSIRHKKETGKSPIVFEHIDAPKTADIPEVKRLKQEISTQQVVDPQKELAPKNTLTAQNIIPANAQQTPLITKIDTNPITIKPNQEVIAQAENKTLVTSKKTTAEFLKEQSQILTKDKVKNTSSTSKSTQNSIDVFTGTFVNYANNDTKVNMGIGLNANVKLSKSIFVSFGAGISQNKIDYQGNNAPSTAAADDNTRSLSLTNTLTSFGNTFTSTTTDVKVAAQILNFDIPVVLKFYPGKKQHIYFAAGINSNTYLSQKYVYNVTKTSISANSLNASLNSSGNKQTSQETEQSELKGFDFANSAIFAIGINQKLGKTNSIIFEPYFKPVIGTMGDKNLKINAVGLNLKFNFTTKK